MTRTSHNNYALIETAVDLDVEPALIGTTHVGRDKAPGYFLTAVAVGPSDADRPRARARLNKSSPRQSV
jgi:hypothetical protein